MELTEKIILENINSEDETKRLYIIDDIISSNNIEFAKFLIQRIEREKSQIVKETIVFGLKKLELESNYEKIFKLFSSPDPFLRNAAVSIMSAYSENAANYLISNLDHSDKEVRKLILDSIVNIKCQNSTLALRAALYDRSINVVITAVEYLSKIEDKDSIPDLLKLFKENNEPMLRMAILEALINLSDEKFNSKNLIKILSNDENINLIDPLYIPQILKLFAKTGDLNDFFEILSNLKNKVIYIKDILNSITDIINKNRFINYEDKIFSLLKELYETKSIENSYKIIILKLLYDIKNDNIIEFIKNEMIKDKEINDEFNELIK